jgi:hypothetical protein
VQEGYKHLKRRLDEMEFVFGKIAANATSQTEMLQQVQTSVANLKLQEEVLK